MSFVRPSVHDITSMLAGNQRAYAMACRNIKDPFNKHLMGQLAMKRNGVLAELDRALVVTGGPPPERSMSEHGSSHEQAPAPEGSDHSIMGHLEYREQITAVLYGALLRDALLSSGIRALLEKHLSASGTILVILSEALRSGAQRAT